MELDDTSKQSEQWKEKMMREREREGALSWKDKCAGGESAARRGAWRGRTRRSRRARLATTNQPPGPHVGEGGAPGERDTGVWGRCKGESGGDRERRHELHPSIVRPR